MLDKYVFGDVSRISPEAPVQVVDVLREGYVPGGAANVANNIAALGGRAFMAGLIGRDESGERLISELEGRDIDTKGILVDKERPTIQKVRVLGRNQQLLRIDFEEIKSIENDMREGMRDYIEGVMSDMDVVVVSDYAKGMVTKDLMRNIVELCRVHKKMLIIDPKPQHKSYYGGASLITPNYKEACEMAGFEGRGEGYEVEIGEKLLKELGTTILLTRGSKGMSLFEINGEITHIPTKAKEVYDVSGAGDTVVGTLALALAAKASLKEAAILANHAAGITVGKLGTSTVSINEIKEDLEHEQEN